MQKKHPVSWWPHLQRGNFSACIWKQSLLHTQCGEATPSSARSTAASSPVWFAAPCLCGGAASPGRLLSSSSHSRPPAASQSPEREDKQRWEMVNSQIDPLPPSPTMCTINKRFERHDEAAGAWHSILLTDYKRHIGILHPQPPPSFLAPEKRVCYEIPPVMSGAAHDLFHVKEVFCRAPWDAEAVGQYKNNIKIVPRALLSTALHPVIILNRTWNVNTFWSSLGKSWVKYTAGEPQQSQNWSQTDRQTCREWPSRMGGALTWDRWSSSSSTFSRAAFFVSASSSRPPTSNTLSR